MTANYYDPKLEERDRALEWAKQQLRERPDHLVAAWNWLTEQKAPPETLIHQTLWLYEQSRQFDTDADDYINEIWDVTL